MRTFKQFKVGDVEYTLSFESFTSMHKDSWNRAYLRIVGGGREFKVAFPNRELRRSWYYNISNPNYRGFLSEINDFRKSQEVRRLIMLFLTNQL
jgi:hypothetical protein